MYKLTNANIVIRISDNASIPMDDSDLDYKAYIEWAKTNSAIPADVIVHDPKDAIRAQIKSMEQAQLMPRATREFMLLFMETSFTPAQLAQNIGYAGIKAFDNQIKALRDQL